MADITARALAARHVVGDRVLLDWLEVARMGLYGEQGGGRVRTAHLMERWDVSQPTVSRRLAAINGAPPSAGLGRVERLRGAQGWWRVTLPTTTSTRTGDRP